MEETGLQTFPAQDAPAEADEALFERYLTGHDPDALGQLVQRHQHFAYRVAFCRCSREAWAEEAAQEAFLQLMRPDCHFKASGPGSFKVWFFTVVSNVARNLTRSERRTMKRPLSPRYQDQVEEQRTARDPDPAWEGDAGPALKSALEELKEDLRLPIVLHYLEGFTQTEVSRMVGVSQSMIAKRIGAGLEVLRKRLSHSGVMLSAAALPQVLTRADMLQAPASLQSALAQLHPLQAASGAAGLPGAAVQHSARTLRAGVSWGWPAGVGAALLLAACALMAGFWFATPNKPPALPEQETADLAKPPPAPSASGQVPVDLHWTFEQGPPGDIEVLHGKWEWREATGAFPARMAVTTERQTYLLLPVRLEPRPYLLTIRAKHQISGYATGGSHWSDGNDLLGSRYWTQPAPTYQNKTELTFYQYFVGRWGISVTKDGQVLGLQEYAGAYPADRLIVDLRNYEVMEVHLRSLAENEVPARYRDPAALIPGMKNGPGKESLVKIRSRADSSSPAR